MKNLKYRQLYGQSYGKEVGKLPQGILRQVKGTNTIFFINNSNTPSDRCKDDTYGRIVVRYRLEKDDPYRTGITVSGD